jgi:hypothetical protein
MSWPAGRENGRRLVIRGAILVASDVFVVGLTVTLGAAAPALHGLIAYSSGGIPQRSAAPTAIRHQPD